MITLPIISKEKSVTVVSGTAHYVTGKLKHIPQKNSKIIVLVFLEAGNVPISKIARAFKKSTTVRRLLSGTAESELYEELIAAQLPKKFPKPNLLIQAERRAASKK
jgi:hypothetical protein